jgi:TPR repeat protein
MRTGQGKDLFLGQAGLAGQAVKGGQQPIQFAVIGEQSIKKKRGFRGGQAAYFLKHFSSGHVVNLALVTPGASWKGKRQYAAPGVAVSGLGIRPVQMAVGHARHGACGFALFRRRSGAFRFKRPRRIMGWQPMANCALAFRWLLVKNIPRRIGLFLKFTACFYRDESYLTFNLKMPAIRKSWDTFEAMQTAAKEGDPQAQCYLGVCYQNGQGLEQNYQEAVQWFRRAADQNDPVAQCYLGVCYWMGQGVPQEFGEAAKWLREAAEQNDPAAQFNLGTLYETGQGVPQNYAEAVKWYREAAERGYPAAQFNLGVFYENGQVVEQNFAEAARWYLAAAKQELADAQCNLGLCYQTGRGVPQSTSTAVQWFIKAAQQGNKTAQHNLGLHYAEIEKPEEL